MKALTLWQPWASLMQVGAKTIETRSWSTDYRGELLICSAKGGLSKKELTEQMNYIHFTDRLFPLIKEGLTIPEQGITYTEFRDKIIQVLPFGMALSVVTLVDVIPVEKIPESPYIIPIHEFHFGDFSKGRYAWITTTRLNVKPLPITGRQGLFNVPEEVESKLELQKVQ